MNIHDWSKKVQLKAWNQIDKWEKAHGMWIYPINLTIAICMIPIMFVELMTFSTRRKE